MAHVWRGLIEEYRDRLPVTDATPVISLREGGTPLVYACVLSEMLGCEVWLKYDGANPTGSFKDRGMTMAISKAAEAGAKAVICASTGNTSASAAAYAAKAGMTCAVLVPQGKIAMGKLAQAIVHGARLLQVDGNFDDCLELARKLAVDYPVELVNSVNPARIEGQKTAAFEVVDQLGRAPDIHCLPVGNAGNITAYWKGYVEYAADGIARPAPACGASRRPAPRRSSAASRSCTPRRSRRRSASATPPPGTGDRRPGRVRRAHRRGDRRRDPRGLPARWPATRRCSASRPARRASPACSRCTRPARSIPGQIGRVHPHGQRAEGHAVGAGVRRRAGRGARRRRGRRRARSGLA